MMINNKGLSSILFAMVFTIVLSLMAIGFATLARNDQRQVLDQNLGYQAQYAAETAVNQLQAEISSPGVFKPSKKDNCSSTDFQLSPSNPAKVTCVKWTNELPTVVINGVDSNPVSIPITTKGASSPTSIKFNWIPSDSGDTKYPSGGFSIDDTRIPILKIAFVETGGAATFRQVYLKPVGGGNSSIGYPVGSGQVVPVECDAENICALTFTGTSALKDGYIAISTLGGTIERAVIELTGAEFEDVQYLIDATAVAQDVTKRVEARVGAGTSWRPGFAVAADKICKDIKIDGTNGDAISSTGVACPS